MEKPAKSRSKIFSFLPKGATVSFQNPPFSPGRDKRSDNQNKFKNKGFSGPIISMIPVEARRKSKSGSFDAQEPTSPKVSCMGQIKHKKKVCKSNRVSTPTQIPTPTPREEKKTKRSSSSIRNIFRGAKPGRKSDVSAEKPPLPDRAPSLSQMKQFTSGRDTFADFNWKAHDRTVESDRRNYYSDEEREESDEEDDEVFVPHSAPMMVGGGGVSLEPRKEVNLWKRRTMAPPRPLQLNVAGKQK